MYLKYLLTSHQVASGNQATDFLGIPDLWIGIKLPSSLSWDMKLIWS